MEQRVVVVLVDGLELLVVTLPEEMNVQLDGIRAHKMTSVFAEHQMSVVYSRYVIPQYSPLKE